ECVFRVCLDVDNLHRAAFEQSPAHRGFATGTDGGVLPKFQELGRQIIGSHRAAGIAVVTKNHSSWRTAEPHGRTQESIEYRPEVECRPTDDLEHVGSGGLLLEGLAQLVQQPRVLDGDNRLGSEILDQLDLLVGEGTNLLAIDDNGTDQLVVLKHW